jgi:hypothetical protein
VTTQGLSRIAGGIAIVAVLVVSGMVAWSVLRHQDPDLAGQQAETPRSGEPIRLGDLTGYVGLIDAAGGTIVVAANPTGADPVTLAVANDAPVTLHGKQGGLADLSKDMPVRVFYEVRNEVKHVTSIQVVADRPQAASTPEAKPAEPKPAGARPAPETRPAEAKPAVEVKPTAGRPVPPPPATQTQPPVESRPPAESKPPGEVKPVPPAMARPPAAAAPAPPPSGPAITPRPAPVPPAVAPPAPPRAPAAQPAERDDDGSAAVDWLLKGPGRR